MRVEYAEFQAIRQVIDELEYLVNNEGTYTSESICSGNETIEKARAELASVKAERDEARVKLAYHDAMSPGLQILQPEALEPKAKKIFADCYGQAEADRLFPREAVKERA